MEEPGRLQSMGLLSQARPSDFTFTFHFHALEKEMETLSNVFAWRIPGMEEPGGLPSMRSHRIGHDWSDLAAAAIVQWELEKEMTTHSSTLAWKIPWTEEPGRLQSMDLQRVGHDWTTSLSFFHSKKIGGVCYSLLQWTMSYKNSSLWPIHLGWPRKVCHTAHWVTQAPLPW